MNKVAAIVFVLLLAKIITLKYQVSFTDLAKYEGWALLGKVELEPSVAKLVLSTQSVGRSNSKTGRLLLQLVRQADWQTEYSAKCKNPIQMPVISFQLSFNGRKSREVPFSFSVDQKDSYRIILKDCQGLMKREYENENLKLRLSIDIFNNGVRILEESQQQL